MFTWMMYNIAHPLLQHHEATCRAPWRAVLNSNSHTPTTLFQVFFFPCTHQVFHTTISFQVFHSLMQTALKGRPAASATVYANIQNTARTLQVFHSTSTRQHHEALEPGSQPAHGRWVVLLNNSHFLPKK